VPALGFRAKRGAANHRRDRDDAGTLLLEHFQEKWDPVFRPKMRQRKNASWSGFCFRSM
jgi:hypothetical protein